MSRIRFAGNIPVNIPTPPTDKANLFFDNTDNTFKAKLDDGSILLLGVTEEYIEDVVGALFQDSSTIDITYNDAGDIITLEILPSSINTSHIDTISPTKIIDTQNERYEIVGILTNNAVPTTITSLNCNIDGTWLVELRASARRIGGLAGNPGDSATFIRTFRIKSIGSSVTIHDYQSSYSSSDNPSFNMPIPIVSGTNVDIRVKGANNNNMYWNCSIIINTNK